MFDLIMLADRGSLFRAVGRLRLRLRPAVRRALHDLRLFARRPRHCWAPHSTSPTLCCDPSGSEGRMTMTVIGWIQILLFCAIIVALVKPLGWYMARVFNGERTLLSPAAATG